jgi:hypothetical protein
VSDRHSRFFGESYPFLKRSAQSLYMAADSTQRDLKREQLRRKAARRRQAVLNRVATTRRTIIGGVAVATCGVAALISAVTPVHAATTHATVLSSSSSDSGSSSDSATQSLSTGSTPSASTGVGTVVSGGS